MYHSLNIKMSIRLVTGKLAIKIQKYTITSISKRKYYIKFTINSAFQIGILHIQL